MAEPTNTLHLTITFDRDLTPEQMRVAAAVCFAPQVEEVLLTTGHDGGPWGYGSAMVTSVTAHEHA